MIVAPAHTSSVAEQKAYNRRKSNKTRQYVGYIPVLYFISYTKPYSKTSETRTNENIIDPSPSQSIDPSKSHAPGPSPLAVTLDHTLNSTNIPTGTVVSSAGLQVNTIIPPPGTAWPNGLSIKIARAFSSRVRYTVNPQASQATAKGPHYGFKSRTVCFTEFRGFGPPNVEFGDVGDIYLDITPHHHELYAKYQYPDQWKKWPGPGFRKTSLPHPDYANRFLWCSLEDRNIGWYSKQGMGNIIGEVPPNASHASFRANVTYIHTEHKVQLPPRFCPLLSLNNLIPLLHNPVPTNANVLIFPSQTTLAAHYTRS